MSEAKPGPVPPVFFLLALLLQWGLHYFLPVARLVPEAWSALGFVTIAAGVGIMGAAAGQFTKAKTEINPFGRPTALVTDGVFRVSRNPMYLAMIVILAGGALAWGTLSPFLVPPALIWLLSRKFIAMEEAKMIRIFGVEYERYQGQVRRWL